jgi:hypothetical protein
MNSDTPRTDAAAGDGTTVPADFAADLECELNEAKAEVERLQAALEDVTVYGDRQAVHIARAALKETK